MIKKYLNAKKLLHTKHLVKNFPMEVKWINNEEIQYKKTPIGENEYKYYKYNINTGEKTIFKPEENKNDISFSPNQKFQVYSENYNLYLKNTENNEIKQITFDGEKYRAYGVYTGTGEPIKKKMRQMSTFPGVLWRKDSKKFVFSVVDERKVKDLYVVQNVTNDKNNPRPILHSFKYALPGDEEIPTATYYIYDLVSGKITPIDYDPLPMNYTPPISNGCMKAVWNKKGDKIYFTALNRFFDNAKLILADVESGKTEILIEEKTDTFFSYDSFGSLDGGMDYNFSNYVFSEKPYIIWQSPKTGYSHFYLYDKNKKTEICSITKGNFEVVNLINVDEEKEEIIFTAREIEGYSDPCAIVLCKVGCHGENFEILTKEDANHQIIMSPDKEKFVDIISEVDIPGETKVKNIVTKEEKIIEKTDITELLSAGYIIPQRFSYTTDDGDKLYGIMIKSPDVKEKAPVIDYIYGGVQRNNVPSTFAWNLGGREVLGGLESMAQLGFICVIIDGRGTPKRGKAFYDHCYKNLGGAAGVEDHVFMITKLAEDVKEIDLEKIGIWGVSGGGYGTVRAMCKYPDFYKAGFAVSGNHNERAYCNSWVERYNGKYDEKMYDEQDNSMIVENLKGKLFLVHGDLDDNVNVSNTMVVVDQLIKHNKDFEMLIVPNTFHDLCMQDYIIRKRWDFFVKTLLNKEPPKEFEL